MSTPTLTIFVIAILFVGAITLREFGGKDGGEP
jgi:hypothetical protein